MSDLPDHGISASIGAILAAAYVHARDFLKGRKKEVEPPQLPAEPSAMSVRIGALAVRVDKLEQEQAMTRHEQAQKLSSIYESLDELRVANAKTAAVLPLVQEQVRDLAEDLRKGRKE